MSCTPPIVNDYPQQPPLHVYQLHFVFDQTYPCDKTSHDEEGSQPLGIHLFPNGRHTETSQLQERFFLAANVAFHLLLHVQCF